LKAHFKGSTSKIKCNKDVLINYGMSGLDESKVTVHPYCPNL